MSSSEDSMSVTDVGGEGAQDEAWSDWEEEQGNEKTRSLFSDVVLDSAEAAMSHDAEHFGFDLRALVRELGLGEYDVIKVVTFVRRSVAGGKGPAEVVAAIRRREEWDRDENLIPVDPEDPMLFVDVGTADFERGAPERGLESLSLEDRCAMLADENEALREALRAMAAASDDIRAARDGAGPSQEDREGGQAGAAAQAARRVENAYFGSYAASNIHREMLSDKIRTDAYRQALEDNPSLMKGARVLDVGCGTGILSLFAARGGASVVVGVEGAANMAGLARQNIAANKMEGKVHVVQGKVEELCGQDGGAAASSRDGGAGAGGSELVAGVAQVDLLVSEWMGYALLFETMLPSVLTARDRWLRPGGAMLPDRARIFVALGARSSLGMDFWDDVYGFNMAPMADATLREVIKSGLVREVASRDLLSEPCVVKDFDLTTVHARELDFTASYSLTLTPGSEEAEVHALVLWFDTEFSDRFCKEKPVLLTTSPHEGQTHWAQTVIPCSPAFRVRGGAAVKGVVSFARSKEHRALDISVTCELENAGHGAPALVSTNTVTMSVVG